MRQALAEFECHPVTRITATVALALALMWVFGLVVTPAVDTKTRAITQKWYGPPAQIYKYEIINPTRLGERASMKFHMSAIRPGCEFQNKLRRYYRLNGKGRAILFFNKPISTGLSDMEVTIPFDLPPVPPGRHTMVSVGVYKCEAGTVELSTPWTDLIVAP